MNDLPALYYSTVYGVPLQGSGGTLFCTWARRLEPEGCGLRVLRVQVQRVGASGLVGFRYRQGKATRLVFENIRSLQPVIPWRDGLDFTRT